MRALLRRSLPAFVAPAFFFSDGFLILDFGFKGGLDLGFVVDAVSVFFGMLLTFRFRPLSCLTHVHCTYNLRTVYVNDVWKHKMSILLSLHIIGAAIALLTGTGALVFKKGRPNHRLSGKVFVVSMLIMGTSAAPLAYAAGNGDMLSGALVCYLVLTSWMTFNPISRKVDVAMMVAAVVLLLSYLYLEWYLATAGNRRPDIPVGVGYVFGSILGLALLGDIRFFVKESISRASKIIRHLWRMCFALFMASVSFFLARAHLFSDLIRDSGALYVLALAPLVLMVFWWGYTLLSTRSRLQVG